MNRRRYAIIPTNLIDQVDFSQVLQDSPETIRYNNDLSKFIVKWDGPMPISINHLSDYDGPYTQSEMLLILTAVEWSKSIDI